MAYATTATTISDAARELGLVSADIADPFASTDPNILQLTTLLNGLGRELALEHDWSQLVTSYTFTTSNGTQTYAPPADFARLVDQSGWNRSTRFPLGGPLSPQNWQYLQALTSSASFVTLFRYQQGTIYLYPTPSSTQTCAYEYMSSYWVAATGAPTTRVADKTTVATDVLFFEPLMLVYGLKWKFLRNKGFDSTAAQQDYQKVKDQAMGKDPAPVLSLNGGRPFIPLLDGHNIPPTGFGQ